MEEDEVEMRQAKEIVRLRQDLQRDFIIEILML